MLPEGGFTRNDGPGHSIAGLDCDVPVIGHFVADKLTLGDMGECVLRNVQFDVVTPVLPVIIGQDILGRGNAKYVTYDYDNMTILIANRNSTMQRINLIDNISFNRSTIVAFHARGADLPPPGQPSASTVEPTLPTVTTPPPALVEPGSTDVKPPPDLIIKWATEQLGVTIDQSNLDHATRVADVLWRYRRVFGDGLNFGLYPHPISIPTDGRPVAIKSRPVPSALKEKVDKELTKMLKLGIIERCAGSGWLSPLMAVAKKNSDDVRLVIDYKRTLNTRLCGTEAYPAPCADDIFAELRPGQGYFASCDLLMGYHQLSIVEADRDKTAFSHAGQVYRYIRAPMGMASSGNEFCKAVNETMTGSGLDQDKIKCYVDDLLVATDTIDNFLELLESLLKALLDNGFRLKGAKCAFLTKSVKFLGKILTKEGISIDPDMAQGIHDLKPPTNKRQVRELTGTLNFIRGFLGTKLRQKVAASSFAEAMSPIYDVMKKDKFIWTAEADAAFTEMKRRLSSAPVLSHFDPSRPIVIACDASDVAAGSFMMQVGPDGTVYCIGAKSKVFSKSERNYSTTRKEAYALKWSCEVWRHFVYGRKFTINTDHRALEYIDRTTFKDKMIGRWQEALAEYDFIINWVPGASNVWADVLSRPNRVDEPIEDDSTPLCKLIEAPDLKVTSAIPSWGCPWITRDQDYKLVLQKKNDDKPMSLIASVNMDEECRRTYNDQMGDILACFTSLLCPKSGGTDEPETCEKGDEATEEAEQKAPTTLDMRRAQRGDPVLSKIIYAKVNEQSVPTLLKSDTWTKSITAAWRYLYVEPGSQVLHYRPDNKMPKVVVPRKLIVHHLDKAHAGSVHSGQRRTEFMLRGHWWPFKNRDICDFIRTCELCVKRKGNYGALPVEKGINQIGDDFGSVIYIDFVSLDTQRGLSKILSLIDSHTRHVSCYPSRHDTAEDTIRALKSWINEAGKRPGIISCDRGRHFDNEKVRRFCADNKIELKLHTSWRPQSSGVLERFHRVLRSGLAVLENEKGLAWPDALREVVLAHNAAPNASTQISPFFARYGRNVELVFPDPERTTSDSPLQHGMSICANISSAAEILNFCNAAHESEVRAENAKRKCIGRLENGDTVYIYRPLNCDNRRTKLPWGLRATVIYSTDLIVKVRFDDGNTDTVHRAHCRLLPDRPDHLKPDAQTRMPTVESRGGNAGAAAPPNVDRTVARPSRARRPPEYYQAGEQ